ncbi:rhomboid family intramembrane serine protease [Chitinispirillales bacterium ANBcel5]|uniref:rhomboid family intramembrane serine protease n=1 Tax=Cellulosispirillum alkaliphilum TaxID=3039283 RepID=UPI002A5543B8|nr:rhomboid family intramembrane serine protease [Chitinispirillales bacterium ANBcel5]
MLYFLFYAVIYTAVLTLYKPEPKSLKTPIPGLRENIASIKVSLILGLVLLFIFLITSNFEFIYLDDGIGSRLSMNNIKYLSGRWFIQAITHVFIHLNQTHLLSNVAAIGLLSAYERRVGAKRYIQVFVIATIASALSVIFLPMQTETLGVSGAVFGLGAAYFLDRKNISLKDWLRTIAVILGLYLVLTLLEMLDSSSVNADEGAHILGFISAAIFCKIIPRKQTVTPDDEEVFKPPLLNFERFLAIESILVVALLAIFYITLQDIRMEGLVIDDLENNNHVYYENIELDELSLYIDSLRGYGFFNHTPNMFLKFEYNDDGILTVLFPAHHSYWENYAVKGYFTAIKSRFNYSFPDKNVQFLMFDRSTGRKNTTQVTYTGQVDYLQWLNPNSDLSPYDKTLDQLHFWKSFFQEAVDLNAKVVDWIGIPTPFRIASNGIALRHFREVESEWILLFKDINDAHEAYSLIRTAFAQCEWVESDNLFVSLVAFFDQIIEHAQR